MEQNELIPPVKAGDKLTLTCLGTGKKGDGIFKYKDFIIIVSDTRISATYNITITKVLPKFAFGKLDAYDLH